MLRGTIRDLVTGRRRAFVRFFAREQDLSHELPDAPLPDAVAMGAEPFFIVGALSAASESVQSARRAGLTGYQCSGYVTDCRG
jgi:hypothetical protein